jgi:hypothetical protein
MKNSTYRREEQVLGEERRKRLGIDFFSNSTSERQNAVQGRLKGPPGILVA